MRQQGTHLFSPTGRSTSLGNDVRLTFESGLSFLLTDKKSQTQPINKHLQFIRESLVARQQANNLDSFGHYLLGVIYREQKDREQAVTSFVKVGGVTIYDSGLVSPASRW